MVPELASMFHALFTQVTRLSRSARAIVPAMRIRFGVVIPLMLAAASASPARADETTDEAQKVLDAAAEHFEEARRLRDLINLAQTLAYSDPKQIQWEFATAYGEIANDPILGPLVSNLAAQYRGGYVKVDLDAGAGIDAAVPAAANAAASAAWEIPLCRILGARAAGLGGYEDGGAVGSYVLTGSACLPLPADTVTFAYTRRGNVRTSLLAVPVILDDRRTGDLYDIGIRFYRYRGEHNQIDVMPFDLQIDVSRDEDGGFGAIWSSLETAPVKWRRRGKGLAGDDQTFGFMNVTLRYQDDDAAVGGRDAGVVIVWPFTLDGIHVTPDITAGAGGGWVTASGTEGAGDMPTQLVDETGVASYLQLDFLLGPVRGNVRVARDYYPTFDAQFVVDDRISSRLDYAQDKLALAATMFAANDRVRRQGATPPAEVVSGGALDAAYSLGHGLHALARVEGAHALVAGTSIDPIVTRFDIRASASLAYHWDRKF
jgi:hypothetical protein